MTVSVEFMQGGLYEEPIIAGGMNNASSDSLLGATKNNMKERKTPLSGRGQTYAEDLVDAAGNFLDRYTMGNASRWLQTAYRSALDLSHGGYDAGNVAIVIVAHNEAGRIGQCLEKLEGIAKPIVIDDASTDGTADIARKHPGVEVYSIKAANVSDARNFGYSKAGGSVVLFLDADLEADAATVKRAISDGVSAIRKGYVGFVAQPSFATRDPLARVISGAQKTLRKGMNAAGHLYSGAQLTANGFFMGARKDVLDRMYAEQGFLFSPQYAGRGEDSAFMRGLLRYGFSKLIGEVGTSARGIEMNGAIKYFGGQALDTLGMNRAAAPAYSRRE